MNPKHLLCLCLLMLSACGDAAMSRAYRETTYTPPPTPGGRMCMDQCREARDYCRESCNLDYRACYNDVQAAAQVEYDKYTRQRFYDHQPVTMMPSDFEHPEACNSEKKSCFADCTHPYNSCYRACGGTVTVTSSCQFLCFE